MVLLIHYIASPIQFQNRIFAPKSRSPMEINPTDYGLPTRVQLEALGDNRLGIRKVIKSRIIRKDAEKIVEIARQIRSVNPALGITLLCSRNICSKSLALLREEQIEVAYLEV
jgi:hypothetical protein